MNNVAIKRVKYCEPIKPHSQDWWVWWIINNGEKNGQRNKRSNGAKEQENIKSY